jgi:hypothetical protein
MCGGVHDRPVRRLLAWLLTLSAWEVMVTCQRIRLTGKSASAIVMTRICAVCGLMHDQPRLIP